MASTSVSSRHPSFALFQQDWQQLRDTAKGQRAIHNAGFKYLPATRGMIADGITDTSQKGWQIWDGYRKRARYTNFVSKALETMLGVMHQKPASIELPAVMEPLLKRATLRRESLQALLRRINEEQLLMGRLGLLLEIPDQVQGDVLPHIALYQAEHIINWDEGTRDETELDSLNMVILDETEEERTRGTFEWERKQKYRVLVLGDPAENEASGPYRVGVFREDGQGASFSEEMLVEPERLGQKLDFIPFVFCNTKDVVPEPDDSPMLDLSNLSLTIYRGDADYRQALFMQGQDTLVTIGAVKEDGTPVRVGAGAQIDLPMGGDAKYIGVESAGLEELRLSQENDKKEASSVSDAILDAVASAAESGEALRVRVAARTASLHQVAFTGAFALEQSLKQIARWVRANPDDVKVTPNTDFVDQRLAGQELGQIMGAKMMGAPASLETIHVNMQNRGFTEKTFEEELEQMEREAELGLPGSGAAEQSETSDPVGGGRGDEETEEQEDQ